jgi:hypothetical protein
MGNQDERIVLSIQWWCFCLLGVQEDISEGNWMDCGIHQQNNAKKSSEVAVETPIHTEHQCWGEYLQPYELGELPADAVQ